MPARSYAPQTFEAAQGLAAERFKPYLPQWAGMKRCPDYLGPEPLTVVWESFQQGFEVEEDARWVTGPGSMETWLAS